MYKNECTHVPHVYCTCSLHVQHMYTNLSVLCFLCVLCNFTFSCSTFEINDYPYHLFKAFISYFYTDTVDLPSEDLPGLFCVATKPFYQKGEAVLCIHCTYNLLVNLTLLLRLPGLK